MARIVPMDQPLIRSQWACGACLKGYRSAEEARACKCTDVSDKEAAKRAEKIVNGEIETESGNA